MIKKLALAALATLSLVAITQPAFAAGAHERDDKEVSSARERAVQAKERASVERVRQSLDRKDAPNKTRNARTPKEVGDPKCRPNGW